MAASTNKVKETLFHVIITEVVLVAAVIMMMLYCFHTSKRVDNLQIELERLQRSITVVGERVYSNRTAKQFYQTESLGE